MSTLTADGLVPFGDSELVLGPVAICGEEVPIPRETTFLYFTLVDCNWRELV